VHAIRRWLRLWRVEPVEISSLTSLPRFARNSWSPLLRARLLPAGTGCRLVGTIGWHPFTRGFTAVWLGLASVFLVGGGACSWPAIASPPAMSC
jgi:hypothetical protein